MYFFQYWMFGCYDQIVSKQSGVIVINKNPHELP
jgi:hypothetical protein